MAVAFQQITRRYTPKDITHYNLICENLKPYISFLSCILTGHQKQLHVFKVHTISFQNRCTADQNESNDHKFSTIPTNRSCDIVLILQDLASLSVAHLLVTDARIYGHKLGCKFEIDDEASEVLHEEFGGDNYTHREHAPYPVLWHQMLLCQLHLSFSPQKDKELAQIRSCRPHVNGPPRPIQR
jgi:hypothetical protein